MSPHPDGLKLARVAGFEPADDGIRIRCLTTWRYPNEKTIGFMGWVVGFEPTYTGATTLGLNHLTIPTMFALAYFYIVCADKLKLHYLSKISWRPGTGSNRRPPA